MKVAGAVVNDMNALPNDLRSHEQHPDANERRHSAANSGGLPNVPLCDPIRSERRYRLIAVAIILLFWVVQYGLYTLEGYVRSGTQAGSSLYIRAIISSWGLILSFGIVEVLESIRHRSLGVRAAAAFLLAIFSAAIQAAIVEQLVPVFFPKLSYDSPYWLMYVEDFFPRLWAFSVFAGISVALSYVVDIREREERIGALQELAHSAQIRALRNQLNPHFLFNALNSITGLISAKRIKDAEMMTENLADFLRLTLALDPLQLITLNEELRLQQLYLDIEQVRFPDRLRVTVDVPEGARRALVPSLVTQPLVENSIKYAVARSTEPVELWISASTDGEALELVVADSGGNALADQSKGGHLGLSNVAERIRMHFGDRSDFLAQARPDGGFCNTIRIPLQVAE
jgi:two-component system, LytTR family, sensor kinase